MNKLDDLLNVIKLAGIETGSRNKTVANITGYTVGTVNRILSGNAVISDRFCLAVYNGLSIMRRSKISMTSEFIDFCEQVWNELENADKKHGDWSNISIIEGANKIVNESTEVLEAALGDDIDGEHGVRCESVQTAVTAYKMFRKVTNHT